MPAPKRSLDVDLLRKDLARRAFAARREVDAFGMEVEVFVFEGRPPRPSPLGDPEAGLPGVLAAVEDYAARHALDVARPGASGAPAREDLPGRFTFEPGGQVEFSSSPTATPLATYEATVRALDGLEAELFARGLRMLSMGANPWQGPGEVALQTNAPRYVCMDAHFASIGAAGELMMRRTCAAHVNLDFGPPSRAARRWRAAQLLSPIALATFAFSPFDRGMLSGAKSLRGLAWRELDATRSGFPRAFLEHPLGAPSEQYLAFALEARVMIVRHAGGWISPGRNLTFAAWMEHGLGGFHPTLDDWHYHLSTLFPEVRPKGFLELRSADAQARPFRSVPLTWWSALLCDDKNLGAVLERLGGTAGDLRRRWDRAAREALDDPELAADAKAIFAWASEAVLRAPLGSYSREMVRAFIAFGERFTVAGRAPADEAVDLFLEHGHFDLDGWQALLERWSAAVDLPAAGERGAAAQVAFRP